MSKPLGLYAILTLLYITHAAMTKRLEATASRYTGKVSSCSTEALMHRITIELTTGDTERLECARQCVMTVHCDAVVYQEFENGSASCVVLSEIRNNTLDTLELPSSKSCVMVYLQTCRNGGRIYEDICLCPDGFTGPSCEYSNPGVCDVEWTTADMTATGGFGSDLAVSDENEYANVKISIRNNKLNLLVVMRSMDSGAYVQRSGYRFFVSFPFFEKESWNKFAPNPRRQYMHAKKSGHVQILSFNGTVGSYSVSQSTESVSFITPRKTRYVVKMSLPEDQDLVLNDFTNGFELFDSNSVTVNEEDGVIVAQLTDRFINMLVGGHFVEPPQRIDYKYVLGQATYLVGFHIADGTISRIGSKAYSPAVYLNPCWINVPSDEIPDHTKPFYVWKKLEVYLRSGKDVRVKIGFSYHTVLETIHFGDSFTFVLAPFLSQREPSFFTSGVYEFRSMISTSSLYESCSHAVEGDMVITYSQLKHPHHVELFVDTRTWNRVFAVFSNSSVADGSVSDLISGVTKGSDVRICIKWLQSGVSRFLDTHMSSVTDDGKVSTESLVTWRTIFDSELHLSKMCDLQYFLVTSDGHVEILLFNIQTPGKAEVQTDVLVTWFLA